MSLKEKFVYDESRAKYSIMKDLIQSLNVDII